MCDAKCAKCNVCVYILLLCDRMGSLSVSNEDVTGDKTYPRDTIRRARNKEGRKYEGEKINVHHLSPEL